MSITRPSLVSSHSSQQILAGSSITLAFSHLLIPLFLKHTHAHRHIDSQTSLQMMAPGLHCMCGSSHYGSVHHSHNYPSSWSLHVTQKSECTTVSHQI